MALDKLTKLTSQSGITTTIDYQMSDLTVDTITVQSGGIKMPVGMSTFQNVTVTGDLTVNGTTTTLDTDLIGVDKLEVSGNNTTAVGIITQAGSGDILRLYDNTTQAVTVQDGGRVLIATTSEGHSNADDLTIATAAGSLGNTGITIRSSTTGDGNIFFSDATSGDGETKGVIKYAHNGDSLRFNTAGDERLRITSAGDVGIGTAVPIVSSGFANLSLVNTNGGQLELKKISNDTRHYIWGNDNLNIGAGYVNGGSSNLIFNVNGSNERLRITSNGNLLLGTNTETNNIRLGNKLGIAGTTAYTGMSISQYAGTTAGHKPMIDFNRSRGSADGTMTSVADDDGLGEIIFRGSDGSNFEDGAAIRAWVDGTPANDTTDMPGRLTFHTSADGDTSLHERLRIDSSGKVGINETSPDAPLHITGGLPHIRLENSGTSASANDVFGQIDFKHNDSDDAGVTAAIKCVAEDNAGNSYLTVHNGDGGNADERLRITSNGRINIGHLHQTGSHLDYTKVNIYGQTSAGGTNKNLNLLNVYNYGDGNVGNITGIGLGCGASPGGYTKASIGFIRTGTYGRGDLIFCINDQGNGNQVVEGNERLRITSGGNLTLGTTVSNERVHIHTASSLKAQQQFTNTTTGTGAGDGLVIGITGGEDSIFWNQENTNMLFATNNTERLHIASDGKILMGVAANNGPAAPLHIYGGSDTTPILAFTRSTVHDDWQGAGIGLDDEGGTYKGSLTFYTHSSSGTKNDSVIEKMRITSAGLVGIGTENPVGNLEVRDTKANLIVAKDGLTVKSNSALATQYDMIQLGAGGALASYSTATATADTQLVHNAYRASSDGNWKRRYQDTAMHFRMNSPGNAFRFFNAPTGNADTNITWTERARIDANGKLQLGSTTATGYNDFDGIGSLNLSNNSADGTVDYTQGIVFCSNASNEGTWTHAGIVATGSSGYNGNLIFATDGSGARDNAASNLTERLRIDSSGRVIVGGDGGHAGGAQLVVKGNSNTLNTYASVAFCRIGANPTSNTTLTNLRFSGGAGGTNRAAEINVKADSNWNDGTSQESKMEFTVAKSGGGNTAGNPILTLKGNGTVEVNRGSLQLAHKLNCSSSEDTGTHITSISHSGDGAFDGGLVFQTRCYEEYHFKWTGQYNHEIIINGPSYMSAWVEYQFTQTNGGADTMNHVRGKWANNHYTHTWNQQYASGGASALSGGVPSITATDQGGNATGSSTTANARLRIYEGYTGSGLSMNNSVLILRVYYASNTMSIAHTGS